MILQWLGVFTNIRIEGLEDPRVRYFVFSCERSRRYLGTTLINGGYILKPTHSKRGHRNPELINVDKTSYLYSF